MKRVLIILTIVALGTGLLFAHVMGWPEKKRPRLALLDAYACAAAALGSDTNQYYCVRACCLISRSPDGEWFLEFCSTNGGFKSVFVFFDKTTKVQNGPVDF
jgi:hypothetical protein